MDLWKLERSETVRDDQGKPVGGRWVSAGEVDDDGVVDALERLKKAHGCARATRGEYSIEMRRHYTAVRKPV